MTETDETLVIIVRTRDKEAYAEIIRRYQSKLLRYAQFLVGDPHCAADIVQESFIKAYINLNGFNEKKKFSSWIYRIVHNEALNAVKKRKKLAPIHEEIENDDGITIEDVYIKNAMVHYAHECLEAMPLLYREPLSLYYLEEKSYDEISDILQISLGTVGTRINRAKAIMKTICQKRK